MSTSNFSSILEAAEKNDLSAIRYFVETKGVNLASTTNLHGESVAHIAAKRGFQPIIEYIFAKDASALKTKDRWNQSALHLAVQNGFLDTVKYLVDVCNADVLESDNFFSFTPPIHVAAAEGKLDILKYFIDQKKIDVNLLDGSGQPCAFFAATYNHLDVVKYLAEETNAQLNITDNKGQNILHMSANTGDTSIPKYLLDEQKLSFDLNARDKSGETVLFRAALFNNFNLVKYLTAEKKVDVNVPSYERITALHEAAKSADLPLVKYLIECGASPENVDCNGLTPLDIAGDEEVVEYLEKVARKENGRNRRFVDEAFGIPVITNNNKVEPSTFNFFFPGVSASYNLKLFASSQVQGGNHFDRAIFSMF